LLFTFEEKERMRATRLRRGIGAVVLLLSFACPGSASAAGLQYKLGPQDKLRIKIGEWRASRAEVYDWKALSGEFVVGPSGDVLLPLLGEIRAEGVTTAELANSISDRLQAKVGLADHPTASVEVAEFRPFYILGNVETPGEYAFRPGLTVLQAISVAGGWRRLDTTLLGLEREAITSRGDLRVAGAERDAMLARRARLQAELEDKDVIAFPTNQSANKRSIGEQAMREEELIFQARKEQLNAKTESMRRLKTMLENEISTLQTKGAALEQQIDLVRKELDNISSLVSKGLSYTSRQLSLEQNIAQLQSTRVDVDLSIVRTRQDIIKTDREIVDLSHQRRNDILTDLRKAEDKLAELSEKAATAENLIHESEVVAPQFVEERTSDRRPPLLTIIRRGIDAELHAMVVQETDPVEPGDTIKVERRSATQQTAAMESVPRLSPYISDADEKAAAEKAAAEKVAAEKAAAERAAIEQAAAEKAATEKAAAEKAATEKAAAEKAATEKAATEKAAAEKAATEKAAAERAAIEKAAAEKAAADNRAQIESERLAREQVEHEVAAAEEEKQAQALKETESEPRVGVPGPVESHKGAGDTGTEIGSLTSPADTSTVPAAPPPPSNALIQEIKKELKRVGCYFGPVDDNWRSSDLKRSLQNFVTFAKVANMPDQPTLDFLDSIRGKSARVCPPSPHTSGKLAGSGTTTGQPSARASRAGRPKPSVKDGNAKHRAL
jgi:polysaccharide biosynthesis/export protein ExoF